MKGRCCICGELIPTVNTSNGDEVASCMHIHELILKPVKWLVTRYLLKFLLIKELTLCPSQFDEPQTFKGLWMCHPCYTKMMGNIATNARDFSIG